MELIDRNEPYCVTVRYESDRIRLYDLISGYVIYIDDDDITLDSKMRYTLNKDYFSDIGPEMTHVFLDNNDAEIIYEIISEWLEEKGEKDATY